MKATPNLNFTTLEPTKESLKTFVTMLRSIYQNLTSLINGHIGFGDGSLSDNVDGTWINAVTPIAPNTDFTVNHNLNRLPVGYWIMQKDKAVDVYTGTVPATKTQLTLKASVASAAIRLFIVGLLLSLFPHRGAAQGANHFNIAVKAVTPSGSSGISGPILQPIAGAFINVCTGTSMPPLGSVCAGTASLFSDTLLSVPISNPTNADINGNYNFWANAGQNYVVSVSGFSVTTYSYVWSAPLSVGSGLTAGQNIIFTGADSFTQILTANISGNAATATSAINATNLIGPGIINGTFSGNPVLSGSLSLSALVNGCTQIVGGLVTSTGIPCATGGVSSVNIAAPIQYNITGCPITTSGTCVIGWNDQQPNTFLRGPMKNGVSGTFDGIAGAIGTSANPAAGPLVPSTTHEWAWFVGQVTGPQVSFAMPGPWVSQQTNGSIGAVFSNQLSTASPITATATVTNSNTWASLEFLLKYSIATTPAVRQKAASAGAFLDGNSVTMPGNTIAGNAILVVMMGQATVSPTTGTFTDSQGNNYTPLGQSEFGVGPIVMAALTTGINAATADVITWHTDPAIPINNGEFVAFELTNIQTPDKQPFFGPITSADVVAAVSQKIQSIRITTGICTTANAAEVKCTSGPYFWPVPFTDANYAITCTTSNPTGTGTNPGNYGPYWTTKFNDQFSVIIQSGSASAAGANTVAEIDCMGIHQ